MLTSTANFQQISYGEANVSEFLEPSRNLAMVATTNREHRLCLCLVNNPWVVCHDLWPAIRKSKSLIH